MYGRLLDALRGIDTGELLAPELAARGKAGLGAMEGFEVEALFACLRSIDEGIAASTPRLRRLSAAVGSAARRARKRSAAAPPGLEELRLLVAATERSSPRASAKKGGGAEDEEGWDPFEVFERLCAFVGSLSDAFAGIRVHRGEGLLDIALRLAYDGDADARIVCKDAAGLAELPGLLSEIEAELAARVERAAVSLELAGRAAEIFALVATIVAANWLVALRLILRALKKLYELLRPSLEGDAAVA
ncbi:MAG TPA: hypothetical protein PLB91_03965 [Spirochaetales bacterium]|nr:hypothetical protein [Spirochaetales bacterium]HRY53457.1 hypothetical protein [Spirochaetia bacterium]